MRIRITLQQPEGAVLNGEPWPDEGDEVEVPTAQGAHLVAAVAVDDKPAPRTRKTRRGGDDA